MAVEPSTVPGLLADWVARQLDPAALAWLEERALSIGRGGLDRELFLAISLVPRRIGKHDLNLTEADLDRARSLRPGWDPGTWSIDQAARLVLALAAAAVDRFFERLEQIFVTADVGELITFYRGLPLYPEPERWTARAAEGARSNMRAVFEAVAHRNPYPAERFPEATWNQMVLKALFVGSALAPIQGLEERQNPTLARMLCDYAHERWAAGRPVSPDLWRCVGRFADDAALADLGRVLAQGNPRERGAAALALTDCPRAEARTLLRAHPDLASALAEGRLAWTTFDPLPSL